MESYHFQLQEPILLTPFVFS